MGLIPHLPLKLTRTVGVYSDRFPLAEVVQGPTAERELALEALRRFLNGLGYTWTLVPVRASEMPLRF